MTSTATHTGGPTLGVDDLDAAGVLAALADSEARIRASERDKLRLVAQWCVLHPARSESECATWADTCHREMLDRDDTLGGDGAPLVAAFAAEEVATTLGISPVAGAQLVADVLNLLHRHPRWWARVQALEVPAWRARRFAQACARLSWEAARWVDEQLAGRADTCGPVTIDRCVGEAKARFEPEEHADAEARRKAHWRVRLDHGVAGEWVGTSSIDAVGDTTDLTRFHDLVCATAEQLGKAGDTDTLEQRKAKALGVIADRLTGTHTGSTTGGASAGSAGRRGGRPRFYLHLEAGMLDEPTGVGAVEQLGPATMAKLRAWLEGSHVTVQPVIDLAATDAVDAYTPPAWMAELVRLRDRHCVFPWCQRDSRGCDLDHITPFDPGTDTDPGPPAQTRPQNLAPLCRRHHRAKTSGRWRYHRNRDGTYTWTSPHRHHYLVTATGTTQA